MPSQSLNSSSLPPLLPSPPTTSSTNTSRNFNVKKISPAEMQLRREKMLCFTYDNKFTPSHRCPNKQYLLLQMDDDEDHIDRP